MEDEIVDIVDEEDNVIKKMKRSEAEKNNCRLRVAKILVFNEEEKLVIQKRIDDKKRNYPGMWDIGIGETVKSDECYEDAAIRGLQEEYGIKVEYLQYLFKFVFRGSLCRNYAVYKVYVNEPVKFDPKEIEKIKKVTKNDLIQMFDIKKFTPPSIPIYQKYLEINNGN